MRRDYFILFAFFLFTLLHPCVSLAQTKCLCLTWAFIVPGDGGHGRVLDVAQQPVIHSGDNLRIVIKPSTHCDVYLFRLDSHGELTILCSMRGYTDIELPREGEWFKVDQTTGIETYYLLATVFELDALEKAVKIYAEKPKSTEAKESVMVEFEKARRTYLEPHVKEEGVQIKGISGEATRVNAGMFYTKTVQIRHE
jgi:hypothetical protein